MLIVRTSKTHFKSRTYSFNIIFEEFLGLKWRHEVDDVDNVCIRFNDDPGEIHLPDIFFGHPEESWLHASTLPAQPLTSWDVRCLSSDISLVDNIIPVIYGMPTPKTFIPGKRVNLPIDIFGSVFFMLSRYEELILPDVDKHGRFPASASLSYQENFLHRPIVDEYVEVLFAAMQILWPQLKRKPKTQKLRITCDVDSPYQTDFSPGSIIRGFLADQIKRRSPSLALRNLNRRWHARKGDFSADPHLESIDWMMSVNGKAGNCVAFYFITDQTHPGYDPDYSLDEKVIRKLFCRIHDSGHEIGLHTSYDSYLSRKQTMHEADLLRRVLQEEKINGENLGGRQHYLRWKHPHTAQNWDAAGMAYDSTLCFADRPGFRCGTSREFTMFDPLDCNPLRLKQRPLAVMETTMVDDQYMGLGYTEEALQQMMVLKENALKIGGEFVLLWHNSSFDKTEAKNIYCELIKH